MFIALIIMDCVLHMITYDFGIAVIFVLNSYIVLFPAFVLIELIEKEDVGLANFGLVIFFHCCHFRS